MILLLSVNEADCLDHKHRGTSGTSHRQQSRRSVYRASGLVLWPKFVQHGSNANGWYRYNSGTRLSPDRALRLSVGFGRPHPCLKDWVLTFTAPTRTSATLPVAAIPFERKLSLAPLNVGGIKRM
jgi:hypothetical protein